MKPSSLDDEFLAPVPTWRMGAMYNDSWPRPKRKTSEAAQGRIELQPPPAVIVPAQVPAPQPKAKRKANGHGFDVQRR
jgi:hypothetical protein